MKTPLGSCAAVCAASALALLAGACDGVVSPERSSDDEVAARLGRVSGAVATPFRARLVTTLADLRPDPSCDPPTLLNVQEGSGHATHLGSFSAVITFCVDLSDLLDDGQLTDGESLPYDNGVGTFIAANGDELHVAISGAVLPSDQPGFDLEFMDPFEITGGTGRFAGATGGGTTTARVSLQVEPSRTEGKWSGVIVRPRGS